MPPDHGSGDPVLAGAVRLFLHRLQEQGRAIPPSAETGYTVPFDPELFKLVALELLDEAGVSSCFTRLPPAWWARALRKVWYWRPSPGQS
jgi:hypothetical protein